jgi:hypothetical protein
MANTRAKVTLGYDYSSLEFGQLLSEFERLNVSNHEGGDCARSTASLHSVRPSMILAPCNFVQHEVLSGVLAQFAVAFSSLDCRGWTGPILHRMMHEHGVYSAIDSVPKSVRHRKSHIRGCRATLPQRLLKYYFRKCGLPFRLKGQRLRIGGHRTWYYSCQRLFFTKENGC